MIYSIVLITFIHKDYKNETEMYSLICQRISLNSCTVCFQVLCYTSEYLCKYTIFYRNSGGMGIFLQSV
ncbi:MAG TPA: hypothetical protein DD657_06030 [Culturomica sp.]|nr:hypothetical protein [Culturomica sp.]